MVDTRPTRASRSSAHGRLPLCGVRQVERRSRVAGQVDGRHTARERHMDDCRRRWACPDVGAGWNRGADGYSGRTPAIKSAVVVSELCRHSAHLENDQPEAASEKASAEVDGHQPTALRQASSAQARESGSPEGACVGGCPRERQGEGAERRAMRGAVVRGDGTGGVSLPTAGGARAPHVRRYWGARTGGKGPKDSGK